MAHISEYVSWRGDLSFADRDFRIEDNLVFSELVYYDFKPVFRGRSFIALKEAVTELDRCGLLKNTRAGSTAEDLNLARICASSRRFGDIVLTDFNDIYDSSDRQFAAVTFLIEGGTRVIAFRGTDSTIIGWKEDFMISYTNVPSQYLALDYAKKHVDESNDDIYILGHSKGAHLALFAAAHLSKEQQEKIKRIYINDGPGFCNGVLDKSLIDEIKDKITKITPEYSIIGRLFEPEVGENIIVRSSSKAIMQHSIQSWLLNDGNGLVECADHAPESNILNDAIERFVEGMNLGARERFVDSLFDSMSDTGATTIKEFAALGPSAFEDLIMKMAGNDALNIKGKARKVRRKDDENLNIFLRAWGYISRQKVIRIGLSLFLAALCFAFPDFAMESVVYAALLILCIYELVLTVRHLKESEWNFRKERPRVIMFIALLVIMSMILVKDGALFVFSSTILGVFFLSLAYQNLINYKIYKRKLFERFRYAFEGIVTLFLGGYILVVPDIENSWYMLSCGSLLLIDAIFEVLKLIRDRKR